MLKTNMSWPISLQKNSRGRSSQQFTCKRSTTKDQAMQISQTGHTCYDTPHFSQHETVNTI